MLQIRQHIWSILVILVLVASCSNDIDVINKIIDSKEEPDAAGINIDVLYSDSARVQTRLTAPQMLQYETGDRPHWEFPEGLHAWLYEKDGSFKAEITAQWAEYDKNTNLWTARNQVVVVDKNNEQLHTEELFWDQGKGEIYSNKFTKYVRANGTIATGQSMRAKQDFSQWKLYNKGNATLKFDEQQ